MLYMTIYNMIYMTDTTSPDWWLIASQKYVLKWHIQIKQSEKRDLWQIGVGDQW